MSQSGIFNVLDSQLTTSDDGSGNHDKLQDLVNSLLSSTGPTFGYGGTILFPSVGTFKIKLGPKYPTAQININKGDAPGAAIIFTGTGQQTNLVPNLVKVDAGDLFVVQNNPGHDENIGGVAFQDMLIGYGSNITSGSAIRLADSPDGGRGSQNVRIFRMVFQDCPTAVTFHSSLQCSMLECTVSSTSGNSNTQNAVVVGGYPTSAIETYIAGCLFRTKNANQTGILINNSEHLRIMNTRVEAWQYGVKFNPQGSAFRTHFENVSIRETAGTAIAPTTQGGALVIQPQTGGSVTESAFVNCEFGPGDTGGTYYTLGGIYVDATSGTIDVLRFVSCTSINWPGPGLQILSGAAGRCAHIEVLGGEYSADGQPIAGTLTKQYGILIGTSGAVASSISNVRIVGASCVGTVLGLTPANQQYGIYVTDGAQNVIIEHCDLTGNVQYAAFVGTGTGTAPTNVFIRNCNASGYTTGNPPFQFSSPGTVEVTDCAGYNDQGTLVTTTMPANNATFYNYNSGSGYYGPVEFYVTPQSSTISNIYIDGNVTHLTSGSFTLGPGENGKINWTMGLAAPTFVMVGK